MELDFHGRRIVAIASFDSFLKSAVALASGLQAAGAQCRFLIASVRAKQLSAAQIKAAGVAGKPQEATIAALANQADVLDADAVILSLDGRRIKEFLLEFRAATSGRMRRPILVAAYPGLVFREHVNGFLDRGAVDLLCLNSDHDYDLYRSAMTALGGDASNAVVTGLPVLWNLEPQPYPKDGSIVFFEQPTVPPHALQRQYLAEALVGLARRLPDAEIVLKPRHRTGETTLHRNRHELLDLIAAADGRKVPNLVVKHEDAVTLLKQARLALTISSTAALEAMRLGVPTRIITDFGVSETLGNTFFISSGCFADFASITGTEEITVRSEWFETVAGLRGGSKLFGQRLQALLEAADCRDEQLPLRLRPALGSDPWMTHALKYGVKALASGDFPRQPSLIRKIAVHFTKFITPM